MKKESRYKKILMAVYHYLIFFLLVAFTITCCTMLFVTTLSETLDITLNNETVNIAAKLTFANVVLLSLIYTIFDTVRRKLTVERPVKQITEAAEKIMQGDFSIRIQLDKSIISDDKFNEIAG